MMRKNSTSGVMESGKCFVFQVRNKIFLECLSSENTSKPILAGASVALSNGIPTTQSSSGTICVEAVSMGASVSVAIGKSIKDTSSGFFGGIVSRSSGACDIGR